jgi:tetratricopeptide (TPR) repeat protein
MGLCYDNLNLFSKAIACYKSFSEVLEGSEDFFAQSLAHNCIGVAYQNMAHSVSVEGGEQHAEKRRAYLQLAVRHHSLHRDSADAEGLFLAQTNMGLVYGALNDLQSATELHQHALKSAIHLSNVSGQSAAIGNLGLTAFHSLDFATARACMERHYQLSASLHDAEGQTNALRLLGEIASKQGQHEEASQLFRESMQATKPQEKDFAKVKLGIATANVSMADRMREMGKQFEVQQKDVAGYLL